MPRGTATKRAKTSAGDRTAKNSEAQELRKRIAARAYEIFEESGRIEGCDLDNWLQAEQEILSEQMDADLG